MVRSPRTTTLPSMSAASGENHFIGGPVQTIVSRMHCVMAKTA
jgi:hypothetical protein